MRIKIQGGRIVDPIRAFDQKGDLYLADGKITSADEFGGADIDITIAAEGKIVCPGFVDLAVSLDFSGDENDAGLAQELHAAAGSGVVAACCAPDRQLPIDTPAMVELVRQRSHALSLTRLLPVGALTLGLAGERLSEMAALKVAGCVAFGNSCYADMANRTLHHALEYATSCDLAVFLYCEDAELAGGGCVHQGTVSTRLGLSAVCEEAEVAAVGRALLLAQKTGVRLHLCRISSARSAEMIAAYKKNNGQVTADIGIAHLAFNEEKIAGFDSNYHMRPPLRSEADRLGLMRYLASGAIDAVCSDHRPLGRDAKMAPFAETRPGLSIIELWLPLMMRQVALGNISLLRAIEAMSVAPAKIAGLGSVDLIPGSPAHVCVFDPDQPITALPGRMISAGVNIPLVEESLNSRVLYTIIAGELVHSYAH